MKKYLSIKELAEILNMSVSGIYSLVYEKRIPFRKVGRLLRFDSEEVEDWIEKHPARERQSHF